MKRLDKSYRIGNIGVLPCKDIEGNYSDRYNVEIVCYYPNPYYGRDEEYPECQTDTQFRVYPDNPYCRVHKSCFKHPETTYVVAWVTNEEEPDVISVGNRPWTLNPEDKKSFEEVIAKIFKDYDC